MLILLVAKGIGYAVCLGCGFRGGPVFPAIFLGVALAALGQVVCSTSRRPSTIAVGAAAGMAAMTRLLFASLLFALLLDGTAEASTPSRSPSWPARPPGSSSTPSTGAGIGPPPRPQAAQPA